MSLGMRKLTGLMAVMSLAARDMEVYPPGGLVGLRRRGSKPYPRLKGPAYSDARPVLKRGKARTRALKLAQVVDWHDERANLYGCHPCPKCGEVRDRAAFKTPSGPTIICGACNDRRPVRG